MQPTSPYGKLKAKPEGTPSQKILSTTTYSYLKDCKHSGATVLQIKTSFFKTQIKSKALDPSLQHHSEDRLTEIKVLLLQLLVGRFHMIKKNFFLIHGIWFSSKMAVFIHRLSFKHHGWLCCYIHKVAEINQNKYCFNWLVTNKRNMNTFLFLGGFVNYFLKPGRRNLTSSAAIKFKCLWIWVLNHSLEKALCLMYLLKTVCQTNVALQKSPHKFPCCHLRRKLVSFPTWSRSTTTWGKHLIKWDSHNLFETCNSIE